MTTIDPAILAKFVEKFGLEPVDGTPFIQGCWNHDLGMFVAVYQFAAAEKQADIARLENRISDMNTELQISDEAFLARIATLEQQRQQDREDIIGERDECGDSCCIATCDSILEQFDARAKEPHHGL